MHNVSQEQATEYMPLSRVEITRFWRDRRFKGMECMTATFLTHEFSPHAHDTFSIGAIENGSQISTIRGTTERTGPGHLYLIDPGQVHDGAPGGDGYHYRMIYPDIALLSEVIEDVTGRAFHGTPSFPRFLPHDPQMALAFQNAHRRLESGAGALEADEGMFSVLAELFSRHGSAIILPVETREKTAVYTARDYLNDNFDTDVGLEELAVIAGLSRAHLIRAFRREFHITPHAYLTDVRIRRARHLLRMGDSPASVALECGFADQAHFTRHFKSRTGITPGQFRAA
ncbi:AraC family transcriptional regulator [Rhizobium sp. Leaf262]|uniref:AraC family transcriptional regulator n=1 Tax=Rhizobium sp. Leaf262 TaxID=1736312 RepID=UPI000715D5A1|nr:AraC family transcriptional regulator [Rhizobium sp. Leaf262]KQO75344.1 AraC family transcriptional regulator [Rhizobium sp. Leaf262]